jgi:hypothetical protein
VLTDLKRHSREIFLQPKKTVLIESTQIRWFSEQSGRSLDLETGSHRCSKLSLLRGNHQARVHSDQMVLVMIRWEAGPGERWPTTLKGQLESDFRNPGDLVRKRGIVTAKRKFNLLYLRVRRRREMKSKMKMIIMW